MGIQGLLPLLKEASEPIHIRKYKGYTVGIDTYCWIHRGAVACASQLAKGEPADHYVRYCLKYVNLLRSLDIKPLLVFDGRNLPAKASVEESRRERREMYSRKGKQFLREGKASEARDCFVKCINVTPEMALDVMKAARSLDVDCIVAPYEADAQLAYLEKNGFVQAVITEDSDLIAFGCKKVIVKLDLAGNCLEIDSSNLNKAMKIGEKFTPDKFRYMCIVAGCDYLASLPGIGIGKARKLFQLTSNPDIFQIIKRMATTLKMKTTVPPEYVEGFQQANNTFLHQLAFDPKKKRLQPLTPYPPEIEPSMLTYAGKYVDEDKAYQMALGNLNFNTMVRMCDYDPVVNKPYDRTKTPRHKLSIWHQDYQPGPGLGSLDQAPEERQATKGREITVEMKQRIIQKERQREDEEEQAPLSDAQLSAAYGHQGHTDGTQWIDECGVVPETPDKKESNEAKPAKRNRFATKLLSKKRANILNNGEVVTSRFFPSNAQDTSAQKPMSIKKEEEEAEEREAEKENIGDQLNTSGLLEGIANIEEEQDRQYKTENDCNLQDGENEELVEVKEERLSEACSKQTHFSKSLATLQKFQRSNSYPVLQKMDNKLSSSSLSQQRKTKTPLRSNSNTDISKDSQSSVIEIDSSQDSVISVKTSSSQPPSSQRQGTPRPRSAFSWSRKEQLQGKTGKSRQSTLSTLSNFAFKPISKTNVMQRKSSFLDSNSDKVHHQGHTMTRKDSIESMGSLLSQNSLSQATLPSSYSIPGSMDMEGIDEDNSRIMFIDSQSSSSQSQDTSSISLTTSQSSQPTPSSSPSQDPSPSFPSSLSPPLPSLNPRAGISDRAFGEADRDRCSTDVEENAKEVAVSRDIRRTGLSRKRKSSQPPENQSVHGGESSSPDTDLVSLSHSATSSPTSSSSYSLPDHERGVAVATASPSKHHRKPIGDSSRLQSKKKQRINSAGFHRKSFQYISDEKVQNARGDEMKMDGDGSEESENTPPRGDYIPISPSKKQSNVTLLGERTNHYQIPPLLQERDEATKKSSTPLPKKQSGLLGRCKTVGLSKKRRPSSNPTTTPKGQMSLLAFMPKPKPKLNPTNNPGVSPSSPSRVANLQDLTPELEGSLISRQGNIVTKRNIFDL